MKTNIQILAFGLLILVAFVVACGSEDEAAQTVDDTPEAMSAVREPPERPDREPLIESEITADGFKAILGTGDLGVGTERIGFVLTSKTGFVTTDGVQITPKYVSDGAEETRPTVDTVFQQWPYGNRGLYTAYVDFDKAGDWVLDISIPGEGGASMSVPLAFEVFDSAYSPMEGQSAVSTKTRTVDDVESLQELTTGSLQDPDLYRISLDRPSRTRCRPSSCSQARPSARTPCAARRSMSSRSSRTPTRRTPTTCTSISTTTPTRSRATSNARSSRPPYASGGCPASSGRSS